MDKNFDKPKSSTRDEWNAENADAAAFLADVKSTKHFTWDSRQEFDVYYSDVDSERRWYDIVDIDARLTIKGLDFFEKSKANKRAEQNSKNQTMLLFITVLLTLANALITVINLTATDEINKQKLQLQGQLKQIHTLQTELSQSRNELYHPTKAKTIPPKKP